MLEFLLFNVILPAIVLYGLYRIIKIQPKPKVTKQSVRLEIKPDPKYLRAIGKYKRRNQRRK